MICELCSNEVAFWEAVIFTGSGYRIVGICDDCLVDERVVSNPVKLLDTNTAGG